MSGLFSTTRDKRADLLLLLAINRQKIDYITPALCAYLGWTTPPTTPLEVLPPDVWTELRSHPAEPLPHTGVITCLRHDATQVRCHVIHYVFNPEHHILLLAPYGTTRSGLRELFDFMNHETRTPINAILGLLELLSQTPLSEEQRQYIDAMRGLAGSLLHLLSDALDSSRISAGKLELKKEFFDLYEIAKNTVDRNKLLYPHLRLTLEYDAALPHQIYADGHRIEQVLINIISNALKHTPTGGVTLRIGFGATEKVLRIEIEDTGTGIAPDEQKRLFAPYERTEGNTTMGSGLGLYISKQIVTLHEGTIGLKSTLGQGTTVTIEIPLILPSATPLSSSPTPSESLQPAQYAPYSAQPLLLVDDNMINVMVVQKFLKRWGYEAVVAQSGVEALNALEEQAFGLILMDLRMPEMDGFEVTRRIRARGDAKSQTPIIALTASTEPSIKERIAEVGMEGYLFKPFNAEELHHTIARYLGWKDDTTNA